MVQNQPTISASMVSRGLPPSQVLAEGQKSADVKHDFTILPSPPAKTVGGGGRISREICRFSPFGPSFGGEGQYCSARLLRHPSPIGAHGLDNLANQEFG